MKEKIKNYFKYEVRYQLRSIRYMFYPLTPILFTVLLITIFDLIFIFIISLIFGRINLDNAIISSMFFGVNASFIVALATEISHNFYQNKRNEIELMDYYMFLFDMQNRVIIPIEEELFDDEEKMDDIESLWIKFPDFIKNYNLVLSEKRKYLSSKECEIIDDISICIKEIELVIKSEVFEGLEETIFNKYNEKTFDYWVPKEIKKELSEEYKRALCKAEMNKAYDKIVKSVFESYPTFYAAFDHYKISRKSIKTDEEFEDLIYDPEVYTDEAEYLYARDSAIVSLTCSNIIVDIDKLIRIARKTPVGGLYLSKSKK